MLIYREKRKRDEDIAKTSIRCSITYGSAVGTVHQEDKTVDQVVDVLERPGLRTVTVDGHVLALEGLDDKVRDDATVVRVHPGSEGVEDTSDTDVDAVLVHIPVGKGLGDTLALVVTSSDTGTVDVTPAAKHVRDINTRTRATQAFQSNSLVLMLGVNLGVTVNLGSGRDQEPSLGPLGQSEHVHGTHERGLDGLDGVVLVVRGGGGAGQVVDLVDLDEEGLDDVVPDHLEVGVTDPVGNLRSDEHSESNGASRDEGQSRATRSRRV